MAAGFKGIDVSKHNGVINWQRVKASGVDFAIIRTGYGNVDNAKQRDAQFESNYKGAKAAGLKVGAYHYSYALTVQEAVKEAQFVLKIIAGKSFEYPIYFDIEDESQKKLTKQQATAITKAFCETLEKAGYWSGVYSYDSFFASHLDASIQDRFTCWVARVENVRPTYCKKYDVWQYSWKGSVPGSSIETDLNISYKDFSAIIPAAGKNGFTKGSVPQKATSAALVTTPQYEITFRCGTAGECQTIQDVVYKNVGKYNGTIKNI